MSNNNPHLSGATLIDRFTDTVGALAKWMCVALVLVQFCVVVGRYMFDVGSVKAQESILYIFGSMFMLALCDALKNDRHVRVDMLYHGFSTARRRLVDGIGILLFLVPLSGFILWVSWDYVSASWAAREGSREAAGLPGIYLLKSIILIAFVLLVLQAMAILRRCIQRGGQGDA